MTLPVAVDSGGFSTELVVTNFSSAAKRVDFAFVADSVQTSNNTVTFFRTMQPFEQFIIPNLVQFLRENGLASALPPGQSYAGPLITTVEGGDLSGIVVGARTAAPGGGGKYGLYYTAVPFGSASTGSAWLYGLSSRMLRTVLTWPSLTPAK